MAATAPTQKQQEIKRLLEGGANIGDIAKVQHTSAQAIYAQISRMRRAGILPKSKRRSGTRVKGHTRTEANGSTVHIPPRPVAEAVASPNGNVTLEQHLDTEITDAAGRLEVNNEQVVKLKAENDQLEARLTKLRAAQEALVA